MAEAEQVEAGLAGSAPSDDRVEQASVATVRVAPPPPEPAAATASPAAPGASAPDHEPSASVRGVPTWTFALPSVPAPPAPPAIGSPAVAAGGPAAAMPPPPPPPPPTTGVAAPHTSASPAVQLLAVPSLGPAGTRRHPLAVALLSVITLGIYTVGWHARVNREMSDFDARLEVRSGASVFGVALAWLVGLLCTLAGAAIIVAHALGVGPALARLASGPVILGVTVPWHDLMLGGTPRRPLPDPSPAHLGRRPGDDSRAGPAGPGAGRRPPRSAASPGRPRLPSSPPRRRRPLLRGLSPVRPQSRLAGDAVARAAGRSAPAVSCPSCPSPSRACRGRGASERRPPAPPWPARSARWAAGCSPSTSTLSQT